MFGKQKLKDKQQKSKGEEIVYEGLGIAKVKDTYKDVDDYISTYEPLLFEEVKAQILQEKDLDECIAFTFHFPFLFGFRENLFTTQFHVGFVN